MSLAEKLVTLRKRKGLTQMDLAEQLNVSRQAISRWEVGAAVPGTDNLKVLGDLYGVTVDYLLDDGAKEPSACIYIEQPKLENQSETKKRRKTKTLLLCLTLVLIAAVIIGAGLGKNEGNNQELVLPMENMTIEEGEENSTVIFPVE